MSELRADLSDWCQSYVAAFNREDAEAIAAHWTFPALTTQAGRSFTFKSAEQFANNTATLLKFYRRQAVDRVERQLLECFELNANTVSMKVSDVMFAEDSTEIVQWQAAYVLQRVGNAWKAVMAVADGETAAWAARGTPLGG